MHTNTLKIGGSLIMKKSIIFDLDGTLWNSAEQVVSAWNEVLKKYLNVQITTDQMMHQFMGKTMTDIANMILPDVDYDTKVSIFNECCNYENEYLLTHGGKLFPNVESTLKELSKDYNLYIVSNCQDGYIQAFMKYHKLEPYFLDFECWGRTKTVKGESIKILMQSNGISNKDAVYVGDTQGDLEACIYADIPFIWAEYGFGNPQDKTYSVSTFSELIQCVPKVFEVNYIC